MTFRSLILLTILAVFVASPLLADCWLDCDDAEAAAIEACDAYNDPVENMQCVRWAMDEYYACLDACEFGEVYRLDPAPWWVSESDRNRCSFGQNQKTQVSASFGGRNASTLPAIVNVTPAVHQSGVQPRAQSQQFLDPIRELAAMIVKSFQADPRNKRQRWVAVRLEVGVPSTSYGAKLDDVAVQRFRQAVEKSY